MGGALSRRIDSLNLREETLSEDGEEITIVVRPPRGAAWRLLQFLWGFALIHYIFYGLFVLLLAVAFRETLFASAAARLGEVRRRRRARVASSLPTGRAPSSELIDTIS